MEDRRSELSVAATTAAVYIMFLLSSPACLQLVTYVFHGSANSIWTTIQVPALLSLDKWLRQNVKSAFSFS